MQRPARFERQGTMTREKRGLESGGGGEKDEFQPEPKRPKVPALASVIVEALKVDSLQKICSSLEPILRRVVSEEVERALAKLGPAKLGARSSPKQIEGPDGRNLQLHFKTKLSLPLFTGGKVEGEQGAAIHVVLLDTNSGRIVTSGPESSAKLDVLVLEGDFNNEDDEDWTEEEFESHVVKEREGKRPLLTGDLQISLKEGIGSLGELTFTDNSSWIRSRKFRLGLKVAADLSTGIRIREAKTEAFTVKDHRGELYKKHYPPSLTDEVWRLEKIGKDGSFHKKLNKCGIFTVEDFLRLVVTDPQRLRNILGSGMSNRMWESLVEHAKTCVLSGKHYIYYADDTRNVGAIFNNIYEFSGLIFGEQFFSAENLNDSQKLFADTLVKKAYDNWMHVIEYDGRALLNFTKGKKANISQKEVPLDSTPYLASYDQQASQLQFQASLPLEQVSVDTRAMSGVVSHPSSGGPISAGYSGNQVAGYSSHPQNAVSSHIGFENTSYSQQNHFISSTHQNHISGNGSISPALVPRHQTNNEFHQLSQSIQHSNLSSSNAWPDQHEGNGTDEFLTEDEIRLRSHSNLSSANSWPDQHGGKGTDEFLTEDEIRLRSHQMLENEDMQHLLRVFSMGGASSSFPDEGYGFPSYMPSPCPNFNFDDDRSRPSGKAVVGWLKIKAAMRWGIFIRKKAAEKRAAQLVELEE